MRFATPITVIVVVLTVCVAPITAEQTTTECGPEMAGDGMNETATDAMTNETTEMMDDGSMTTTETMGNESMDGMANETTTESMGNESMNETTEMMNETTTTCASGGMDDGMADETTDAPESGSSAFAPGFGVAAAVVALLAALYVARE